MSEICIEWLKNPLKNPRSGRSIKNTGKTYKDLEKECGQQQDNNAVLCEKFKKDPTINPETGRKIQKDRTIYKKYMKMCKEGEECFNQEDPITMEPFNETLQPVIKLGNGPKKHCFTVSTIYESIVSQIVDCIVPVNPLTKELLDQHDINRIFKTRKTYFESVKFADAKPPNEKNLITTIKQNLRDNSPAIVEIKMLTPDDVLERYDNLLKKSHKSDAYKLRVVWEFFNLPTNKRLLPLKSFEKDVALSAFNRINIDFLQPDEVVKIYRITNYSKDEINTRVKVLKKIDKIQSIIEFNIWLRYSMNK